MADVLAKVQEMKAMFADIEAELQATQSAPAVGEDFKAELDKAKADLDKYKSIINAHLDDEKSDTAKLEKDLGDLDPVIPDAPVAPAPAPAAPADPASVAPAAAPADPAAPAPEAPAADASPAGVSLDSPS